MLTLFAAAVFALAGATRTTPVSKAIDLLTDLSAKITAEGEAAKKSFEESSALCKDRSKDLGFDIQTQEAQVADLEAKISEETASISSLGQKIESLSSSISQNELDLQAATEIRKKEAADFAAEEKELKEIIDTLERAIAILTREMQKGGSLLQGQSSVLPALNALVSGSMLSSADASRLSALIQSSHAAGDDADDMALGAPDAAVYEGHSQGIIETLEDLLDTAQKQLADARKAEINAIHNFKMLEQTLTDETKYLSTDMSNSKKAKSASSASKASAEGDLTVTSKSLAADKSSLQALTSTCDQEKKDYDAAVASRTDELKAIASAKKALSEMTVGADSLSYGLNQVSFVQRSMLSSSVDLAGFEVERLLRNLANKDHTPELAQLASRVEATIRHSEQVGEDPFAKVKALISDLIEKLESEASAEASHKAHCDEELAESNAKKDEKTEDIDKLTANIDRMSANSAKLKEEIALLSKSLAKLAATQAEMDKIRKQEHDTFVANKADMEQGLEGVDLALKYLREYYAQEGKAHEAAEGSSTSIIGLLEVIQSDFSEDLAKMTTVESSAKDLYDQDSQQNEIQKTVMQQDTKYKTRESAALDEAVSEASSDRANVQAELDAVNEYLSALDAECNATALTYEARKQRREAEIAGLKEALSILESETALVQKSDSRSRKHLRSKFARK